jgi:hypothetical protein
MKKLLCLALTLGLAPHALASDPAISLGPLSGTAASIAIDPDDDLVQLVTLYQDGLRRSTDGGQSFEPYGTGLPKADFRKLVLDPKDHDRVLLVAANEAWHSLDFGLTWTSLGLADPSLRKLAVSPTTGDIYAAAGTTLYHSTDNGVTWGTAATGTLLYEVAISPSAPSNVVYGSINGLFKSTDNGATFNPTGMTSWVQAAAFKPTDPSLVLAGSSNGIYKSTDGATTFTQITAGLPGFANAEFFAYSPGGALWLALLDGMWVSLNDGTTWMNANQGLGGQPPIPTDASFDSTGDIFISAEASGGGIWRTVGQQLPWKHIAFPTHTSFTVAFASGTRIAGGADGVYKAVPGTGMSPTNWQADLGTHTEVVRVDSSDATRWVTGGVGSFIDNAQIVVLTNSGQNVAKTYEAFGAGRVVTIERDPSNASHLLAGVYPAGFGNAGILTSSDAGQTWSPVGGTAGWANRAITFDPFLASHVLELSENGQWSESFDGGATWTGLQLAFPVTGPAILFAFDPNVPNTIYRGDTGTGLHKSDDGGTTWTSLGVGLGMRSHIQFSPDEPGLFWISDASGTVQLTGDAGATFETAFTAPTASPCTGLDLDAATGNLLIGTDGASTWELPHASPYLNLGGGTAGSGGFVPHHFATGGLPKIGSMTFGFGINDAIGGGVAVLATSVVDAALPVFGGTLHPSAPYVTFTAHVLGGTAGLAGDGGFTTTLGIPSSVSLVGLELFSQVAVLGDAGASDPSGFVLSNGLSTRLMP